MSSIPLPALGIHAPQQPDLLEKFGQLQQLRASQQQLQMQQQEAPLRMQQLQQGVESSGLQVQQQQQALKDQQAMTASMQQWDGKSLDELVPLVLKNGGSANAVMGLKQHALEQKAKISAIAKDDAETGKNQIETAMQKNNAVSGALGSILQVPDEQLPQALSSTAQQLAQQGLIDPQHVQLAQQLAQSGNPQQIRQQLDVMRKGLTSNSQLMEQAKADQQAANQDAMRKQAADNAKQTQLNENRAAGQRQQGLNIESARLAFDKARQGTQDQQAIESQAQQIASGDVKALSQARNNPFARAVMARVYEINPKYSDSLYNMTQAVRSDKPNTMGGNVQKLGTAILHGDAALNNSQNLGFSEGLLTGVGTAGTAAYKQDAEFLKGEIGQYVQGGKLTVDEGNKLGTDLLSSRQGVRDSAIKQIITLSGGKLKAQMEQFKNATQNDFPTDRVFNDPDIKGALQKHGVLNAPQASGGNHVVTHVYNPATGQIEAK